MVICEDWGVGGIAIPVRSNSISMDDPYGRSRTAIDLRPTGREQLDDRMHHGSAPSRVGEGHRRTRSRSASARPRIGSLLADPRHCLGRSKSANAVNLGQGTPAHRLHLRGGVLIAHDDVDPARLSMPEILRNAGWSMSHVQLLAVRGTLLLTGSATTAGSRQARLNDMRAVLHAMGFGWADRGCHPVRPKIRLMTPAERCSKMRENNKWEGLETQSVHTSQTWPLAGIRCGPFENGLKINLSCLFLSSSNMCWAEFVRGRFSLVGSVDLR